MNTAPSPNAPSTSNPQHQQNQLNQVMVPIPRLPPNLPRGDLIEGKEDYINIYLPLREASRKGDWKVAKAILEKRLELVRYGITKNYDTMLHIAASVNSTTSTVEFVKELFGFMSHTDLELQNEDYNTAFSLAASAGNLEIAKIMLEKNRCLLEIPGKEGMMPLYLAALFKREHMVRYLFSIHGNLFNEYWNDQNLFLFLQKCVEADIFDVALKIVKDHPNLISDICLLRDLLVVLARKPEAYEEKKPHIISRIVNSIFAVCHVKIGQTQSESHALQLLKALLKHFVIMEEHAVNEFMGGQYFQWMKYSNEVLFVAAKLSNMRFIMELIKLNPDLLLEVDDKGQSIFHIAAEHRNTQIIDLLYKIGSKKDQITHLEDKYGNNMLHLAAMFNPAEQVESGSIINMNYELFWYKEVEQIIPHTHRKRKNKEGEKPYDIFRRKHAHIVPEVGKWMKDTVSQCMVVATLITTVVFAATFTLPGGYNQNTGIPMFFNDKGLIVFVVADVISLVFSSTSVLVFLSMITSRYTEYDIMITLPKKMAFGFATLFLSVVTMMIAFSANFTILYIKNLKWIPKMVIGLSTTPVLIFGLLQYNLIGDIFSSIYQSRYFFKRMM